MLWKTEQGRGEGNLGKVDVASPLTTWSHTLQWLLLITVDDYFTSIAICVWTLGVLCYRGNLNASIHFIKSFCDVSQLFMIQVSSIRNTYVTPQRFIKWGLSQCSLWGHRGKCNGSCIVWRGTKFLGWHLLQFFWEAEGGLEVLWRWALTSHERKKKPGKDVTQLYHMDLIYH